MPFISRSAIRLLAEAASLADVVAGLHALTSNASGATRTVLLELEAGTRRLRPTSAAGFDDPVSEVWLLAPEDESIVAGLFESGRPQPFGPSGTAVPGFARPLGTPVVVVAPVVATGRPVGLLAAGGSSVDCRPEVLDRLTDCADAFGLAIERARQQRDSALRRDLHNLIVALGRGATPELHAGRLVPLCKDVARLFAAGRACLWIHDRRAQQLELAAASDADPQAGSVRVSTSDPVHPAATAMRALRASLIPSPSGGGTGTAIVLAVPLQAHRRALGTLVVEGIRVTPGELASVLERLDDLGQHLANVLEGARLIREIVQTRRELENTFDSMEDLVLVCTREGRVARANVAAARRLGRTREALASCPVAELVDEPLARWLADGAAAGRQPWETRATEISDAVLGGTFRVTSTPLFDANRVLGGSVLVMQDVSEERRLESERAALREQLAQSETLSQLVAGIAHELNNPLQAVLGHIELLRHTERLSNRVGAALRQAYRESSRAARIVHNLLLLAGSGRFARRPISVNAAVKRALALRAGPCRRAGIVIDRRLDETLPRTAGDALLLQQAIHNLVINAEQALAGPGGRIEVSTALEPGSNRIVLEIHDTGTGIPADVRPRIFEPFFTTKHSGSGLGLAVAKRIIREHGGDIDAASRPGGGATFRVHLPAAKMVR